MARIVNISNFKRSFDGGVCRVSADVDGAEVWFESSDVALNTFPEAFATAFLIPALSQGAALRSSSPLSPRWQRNCAMLMGIVREWWGYQPQSPQSGGEWRQTPSTPRRTALCFSGGVDSFYSLFHGYTTVDALVMVHGYDIQLCDDIRGAGAIKSLRAVASDLSLHSIVIRTNLRLHPLFRAVAWSRTHGGGLAAIGHLLRDQYSQLVISSSQPYCSSVGLGSHWRIDELWSNEHLHVSHVGAWALRNEKLREIAHHYLVRKHLRVCWKNLEPEGNCGRCEKCLRTMLILETCHELKKYDVFPARDILLQNLNRLSSIEDTNLFLVYREILGHELSPELRAAVMNLLSRSEQRHRQARQFEVRLLKGLKRWLSYRVGALLRA